MNKPRQIKLLQALAVASLLFSTSAQAAITNRVSRSFPVGDGGTLTVSTSVGSIDIVIGGSGIVNVDVTRTAKTTSADRAREIFDEFPIEYSQSGNDVRITARRKSAIDFLSFLGDRMDAHFVVTVPARYNVDLSTAGGNLKVADLNGRADCRTSGGDIALGKISGPVEARTSGGDVSLINGGNVVLLKTSGGDITIGQAGDRLQALTSGGSIDIGTVRGSVVAKTSGGDISIRDVFGAIDAVTSGGNVTARISQQPGGSSRLSTSGGSVLVSLAGNISLDVDAETSGGSVRAELPITSSGKIVSGSLHGKLNNGGPRLVLRSSGGNIRLSRM